jgi:TldD protein
MIEQHLLEKVLTEALRTGGDWAEVFAEDRRATGISLDDGKVDQVTSGHTRGAGVRVVRGGSTGFAHTTDLSERGLLAAARSAGAAARSVTSNNSVVALERDSQQPTPTDYTPNSVARTTKVALLQEADEIARQAGGDYVRQVSVGYGDSCREILVANSEGLVRTDARVRTRFNVGVVAGDDNGMQTGSESAGLTVGFELFDRYGVADMAGAAARRAVSKLSARPAPSGELPVVIAPGVGGVLFHEACGHGLEADLVGRDASVYARRVGEQVASPLVTIVDDGTYLDEWGSYAFDDEGNPSQRNVLIQNGVLTDYMWDFLRSRKNDCPVSGNGRRESYDVLPMVRMTNTYLENGTEDPAEIVRQTPYGIYVKKLGGGQVNTTTGDFVFGMTEAYLIEDGKITHALRDANLIGNGPKVLMDIDVMGNDFSMGGPGTCGKDGQGVPVGLGQPTLRVRSMTIGGTN